MSTVMVTGGAGFVGSHLCERLIASGDFVICVDNFQTGSESNVAHLLDRENFKLVPQDVVEPLAVEADVICNLACPASPLHYQADPIGTIRTNVIGALNVLDLARRCHAVVFQASTSEVYGDPLVHPQFESYWGHVNPIGERSCYDEGKRCAETLFFDYRRLHGLAIKVGRIFNTYGPRMQPDDGRVVSNFIVQALRNEPLTIYGDGSQTRSFCYIDDLVDGIVRFVAAPDDVTGPFNLGNPEEFTVLELAERVLDITGSRSKVAFKPLPPDDPKHRRPDISLACRQLNWQPVVTLDEGLLKTISYLEALICSQCSAARSCLA